MTDNSMATPMLVIAHRDAVITDKERDEWLKFPADEQDQRVLNRAIEVSGIKPRGLDLTK